MLWLRSVTAIEVISIVFLFHSNQWRTWCIVVPKDEPVHDLLRIDETITDGSAGVFHIPVVLVRVRNHDDGRVLMESRPSMDGRVDQGIKITRYIFLVPISFQRMSYMDEYGTTHFSLTPSGVNVVFLLDCPLVLST